MTRYRVDFAADPRTRGWPLLALGIAAVVGAFWLTGHWSRIDSERQEAARRADESAARQQLAATQQRRIPAAESKRLHNLGLQLRQPWLPVLRIIENATEPPTLLTGLAIDPATATVRIEGESQSFEQVLRYADSLNEPRLLGPRLAAIHERGIDSAGSEVVRFTITTQWQLP